MPNGTYGGVRGRKTKEIGGKLRKSFVFLLLDYPQLHFSTLIVTNCRRKFVYLHDLSTTPYT